MIWIDPEPLWLFCSATQIKSYDLESAKSCSSQRAKSEEKMIASTCFSDDPFEIAQLQHELYGEALMTIRDRCERHILEAADLLGLPHPAVKWANQRIDHRCLQMAHDILAAAWRFRSNSAQHYFNFGQTTKAACIDSWLAWLRREVDSWRHEPALVRFVRTILENQNTDRGRTAEDELSLSLLERFKDVPWHAQWHELKRHLFAQQQARAARNEELLTRSSSSEDEN